MQLRERPTWVTRLSVSVAASSMAFAAACDSGTGTFSRTSTFDPSTAESPYAPGIDSRKEAVSGLEVGHRLMAAGQYELALDAFTRAVLEEGATAEVFSSLGSANLALGRLGQAEEQLRRAVKLDPEWPEALNNLGIVLLERGEFAESEQILRRAYALDDGESDAIRDNLRLALEMLENSAHSDLNGGEYKLVQYGGGLYRLQQTP